MTRKEVGVFVYNIWKQDPIKEFPKNGIFSIYTYELEYIQKCYENYLVCNGLEYSMKYLGYFIYDVLYDETEDFTIFDNIGLKKGFYYYIYTGDIKERLENHSWIFSLFDSDFITILEQNDKERNS